MFEVFISSCCVSKKLRCKKKRKKVFPSVLIKRSKPTQNIYMSRRDRPEDQQQQDQQHQQQNPFVKKVATRMRSDWPALTKDQIEKEPQILTSILLNQHDKPHRQSALEWWYINGHVQPQGGGECNISFFAAFFRLHQSRDNLLKPESQVTDADRDAVLDSERLYAINWAVTDHRDNTYRPFSYVDNDTPKALLEMMKLGVWQGNAHLKEALKEIFSKGRVPAPDKRFTKPTVCELDKLHIEMQGCSFSEYYEHGVRKYKLHLEGSDEKGSICIDTVVEPTKAPVVHGRNGIVATEENVKGTEDMYYYFVPRCNFTGTAKFGSDFSDDTPPLQQQISGLSWIDHEFGCGIPTSREEIEAAVIAPLKSRNGQDYAWEWAAIQLIENDTEVSAVRLKNGPSLIDSFVIVREGTNAQYRLESNQIEFVPLKDNNNNGQQSKFVSPRTSQEFNIRWALNFKSAITGADVNLILQPRTIDQEFVTLAAKPSFWEGHVGVQGTWGGKNLTGNGYLECRGAASNGTIDDLFNILHTVFCMPLRLAIKSIPVAGNSSPTDFKDYITQEVDKTLAASPPEISAQFEKETHLKSLLISVACAYLYLVKNGKNLRGRALDWLEDRFIAHPQFSSPPFAVVILRAFSLREVDIACGLVPELSLSSLETTTTEDLDEDGAALTSTNNNNKKKSEHSPNPPVSLSTAPNASESEILERVSKVVGFRVRPFTSPPNDSNALQLALFSITRAEFELCSKSFTGGWE
jgi:predicted secreted hydrolase